MRRVGAGLKTRVGMSPSRRRRLPLAARGKRAAGRAAYRAVMLCSIESMVTNHTGVASKRRIDSAACGASEPRDSAREISRSAAAR